MKSSWMKTRRAWGTRIRGDLLASFVVFLVALPLCMGIAIASGVPVAAGLITGIVGGLVVGWIAGCPLQVSGPAAGLTVIVFDVVRDHGLQALGPIVLLAGLIQVIAGLMRLGQWFRAVSPAVIKGMLAGIGFLIMASQFHVMIDDKPKGSGAENLVSIPAAVAKVFTPSDFTDLKSHQWAAAIGVFTILLMVFWQSLAPKKLRAVPAPLVAVVLASVVAALAALPVLYVEAPVNLWDDVRFPAWNMLASTWTELLPVALLVAVLASAETLLCATAVDQMQQGPRTNYDRELVAQGIGNSFCGLLGALPMTGVIVRSSANVQAGAQSRFAAILHGVWLLLFVVALTFVLNSIPTASLAAMLVYTGYKLVDMKSLRELQHYGRGEVAIYAATVGTIVFADLLTGVLVGMGLSAAKLLYTFSHLATKLDISRASSKAVLGLHGSATFFRLPRLAAVLEKIPRGAELHVDFTHLHYIDHSCLDLLMHWSKQHESTGGTLVLDWDSLRARFLRGATNKLLS